jgi:hypothetical protein
VRASGVGPVALLELGRQRPAPRLQLRARRASPVTHPPPPTSRPAQARGARGRTWAIRRSRSSSSARASSSSAPCDDTCPRLPPAPAQPPARPSPAARPPQPGRPPHQPAGRATRAGRRPAFAARRAAPARAGAQPARCEWRVGGVRGGVRGAEAGGPWPRVGGACRAACPGSMPRASVRPYPSRGRRQSTCRPPGAACRRSLSATGPCLSPARRP